MITISVSKLNSPQIVRMGKTENNKTKQKKLTDCFQEPLKQKRKQKRPKELKILK